MYRTRRLVGAPPPGWDLPPGWGQPLDDPQPYPAARPSGRWVYPTLAVTGFLVVTGSRCATTTPAPACPPAGCSPSPWPPRWSSC